jgi:nucleoid DNA-binding protein
MTNEETSMTYRKMIAEVARHLPHYTQHDIAEVVDILTEIWAHELQDKQTVSIPNLGRLRLEIQDLQAVGIMNPHKRLARIYGRFRPNPKIKLAIRRRHEQT